MRYLLHKSNKLFSTAGHAKRHTSKRKAKASPCHLSSSMSRSHPLNPYPIRKSRSSSRYETLVTLRACPSSRLCKCTCRRRRRMACEVLEIFLSSCNNTSVVTTDAAFCKSTWKTLCFFTTTLATIGAQVIITTIVHAIVCACTTPCWPKAFHDLVPTHRSGSALSPKWLSIHVYFYDRYELNTQ